MKAALLVIALSLGAGIYALGYLEGRRNTDAALAVAARWERLANGWETEALRGRLAVTREGFVVGPGVWRECGQTPVQPAVCERRVIDLGTRGGEPR
jgi:hypothetical protein